jgi:hypothetical protein
VAPAPEPAPSLVAAQQAQAAQQNQSGRGGRNQQAQNGRNQQMAQAGRGGRGQNAAPQQQLEFQQVGVNQSADSMLFNQEGIITDEMNADLSMSANQSVVLQGSMSSVIGMRGENDWGPFGGRGMMDPGMMMMGPGGIMGEGMAPMGGMNTDGAMGQNASGMDGAGAAGGRGGMGGGGAIGMAGGQGGRGGMGGGMMGGPGGRGGMGGGPMMGGPGGRGGRGGDAAAGRGGRGAPAWMGQANARAFGNNRRDPRMMYNAALSINERNSILNAQQYSLSGQNIDKPYSNNTSVTGSFGGPLRNRLYICASTSLYACYVNTQGASKP